MVYPIWYWLLDLETDLLLASAAWSFGIALLILPADIDAIIPLGLWFEFDDAALFWAAPTLRFIFFLLEFGLIEFYFRLFDCYLLIRLAFYISFIDFKICIGIAFNIQKKFTVKTFDKMFF